MLTWTQTNQSTVQLADSHHLVFLSLLANIRSSPHTPVFQAAPEHRWSNPLWSMITSPRGFSLGWPTPPTPTPPLHWRNLELVLAIVRLSKQLCKQLTLLWSAFWSKRIQSTSQTPFLICTTHAFWSNIPHQVLQNAIHLHNNYKSFKILYTHIIITPSPSKYYTPT